MKRVVAVLLMLPLAFTLTYVSVWGSMRWLMEGGMASGNTASALRWLGSDLGEYAKECGRYPASLEEFVEWSKEHQRFHSPLVDESGKLWRAPYQKTFQYQTRGRSYRIYTVGRDGSVGGLELTGDLDHDPDGTVRTGPTLHEFLYESPYRKLLFWIDTVTCVLAGVVCFVLPPRLSESPPSRLVVVLSIVVIVVAAQIRADCLAWCLGWVWIGFFFAARKLDSRKCLLWTAILSVLATAALAIFGLRLLGTYLLPVIWIVCYLLARQAYSRRHSSLLILLSAAMATVFAVAVSQCALFAYMVVEYK